MGLFSGLSAFPITPAEATGRVEAKVYERLLARLVAADVDSIGVLGSTGSSVYLSRGERRRAVAIAREVAGAAVPLLVGVGALTTGAAIDLARDAAAEGADGLLLAPVSYLPLRDAEVLELFRAVSAATDLPVCVYNNPTTTRFTVGPALLGQLAAIPNVVAAKNPAAPPEAVDDEHLAYRREVPADFSLGYSGDWNAVAALLAGGTTWYSVAGGLFPEPCAAIVRAIEAGEADRARALDRALAPLWDLFRIHTSFRVVHAAAHHLGLTAGDPPRPILPLEAEAARAVTETIDRLGLT